MVFLSDNGGKPDDNGSLNTPLRGEKGQLWEGGIRVPFCMKWPARVKGGRMRDFRVTPLNICLLCLRRWVVSLMATWMASI